MADRALREAPWGQCQRQKYHLLQRHRHPQRSSHSSSWTSLKRERSIYSVKKKGRRIFQNEIKKNEINWCDDNHDHDRSRQWIQTKASNKWPEEWLLQKVQIEVPPFPIFAIHLVKVFLSIFHTVATMLAHLSLPQQGINLPLKVVFCKEERRSCSPRKRREGGKWKLVEKNWPIKTWQKYLTIYSLFLGTYYCPPQPAWRSRWCLWSANRLDLWPTERIVVSCAAQSSYNCRSIPSSSALVASSSTAAGNIKVNNKKKQKK